MRKKMVVMSLALVLLIGIGANACGGEEVTPLPNEEEDEAAQPETVTFPDGNLEAAVRDALGKPGGETITTAELAEITTLTAKSSDITDLSGLEYCTNLTKLNLYLNQISDIAPLVENSGLGAGDEVWLEDNNLDLSEGSEDMENIRALEDRGVTVHY